MNSKVKNPLKRQQIQKEKVLYFKAISDLLSPNDISLSASSERTPFRKHKKQNYQRQQQQPTLSKISSDPKLLLSNSYIRLKDSENKNFQNAIGNLTQRESHQLKTVRSAGSLFMGSEMINPERKKLKFTRKAEGCEGLVQKESFQEPDERIERQLIEKQKELERIKGDHELTLKVLQKRNKKIKDYEKIISMMKKENIEKIKKFQSKITEQEEEIEGKNQQIKELSQQLNIIEAKNQHLEKRIEEMMSQASLFKEGQQNMTGNFSLSLDMDSVGYVGQLQDKIYKQNLQIYNLNQAIQKLQIKIHFSELKNEQNLKRIQASTQKRHNEMMKRLRCLRSREYELQRNKIRKQMESDIDFSLSPQH